MLHFRNIRRYLLSENKLRKYLLYAIGEIILIVIGILIALQINNWNELRKESIEEQKILHVLKSEFQYNKQELDRNIIKANKLRARADSLILLFGVPRKVLNPNEVSHLIRSLSAYSTFDPSNGALFNLINSGRLDIIKNDSLRLHLSKWFGELQDVKEDEVRLINFGDNQMDPLRLESLNYNPASKLPASSTALLNNLKFENIVARISFSVTYILENYETLDSDIERILRHIDHELSAKK